MVDTIDRPLREAVQRPRTLTENLRRLPVSLQGSPQAIDRRSVGRGGQGVDLSENVAYRPQQGET